MNTLLDLANQLDKFVGNVSETTNEVVKTTALAIVTDLAEHTPADTGTAISNWQVSLGTPDVGILSAYVPSPRGKTIRKVWTHSADPVVTRENNAPLTIEVAKRILAMRKAGEVIFIASCVPHIKPLDEGHSSQEPAGFVDRAVIVGREVSKVVAVEKFKG
jgi:hypothetical protein